MTLLEELPKEIEANQFNSFLDKIKVEFPVNEYPELFVHYQKVNHKLLILAIGKSSQCLATEKVRLGLKSTGT